MEFFFQSDIGERIIGGEFKLIFLQFIVKAPYINNIRGVFEDGSIKVNTTNNKTWYYYVLNMI